MEIFPLMKDTLPSMNSLFESRHIFSFISCKRRNTCIYIIRSFPAAFDFSPHLGRVSHKYTIPIPIPCFGSLNQRSLKPMKELNNEKKHEPQLAKKP